MTLSLIVTEASTLKLDLLIAEQILLDFIMTILPELKQAQVFVLMATIAL